ncbi:MAG: hypothetical protein CMP48_10805 [Rickettsiales bacterium]|nr:hypothetical protein [Rickettsiales bacterium]
MRFLLFCISLISCFQLSAQWSIKPIAQRQAKQNITEKTLTLPFWDDFSTSSDSPDTLLWAKGPEIYINATIAKNAPSYKAATFDGLNASGVAYDIDAEYNGAGDTLLTHYIDLSQVSASMQDSVFLSFYWQAGGNGEMPDVNDSLVVYFKTLNPDGSYSWDIKWSKKGGVSNENFTQALLQLDKSSYFHSQFQFMFISYSSLQGPFDTWHVDYIYLNENRTADDFNEQDQALTGSPSLLFAPYYELPSKVFYADPEKYLSNQTLTINNLSEGFTPARIEYNLTNLTTGSDYGTYSQDITTLNALSSQTVNNTGFGTMVISPQSEPLDSQVMQSTFKCIIPSEILSVYEINSNQDTIFYDIDLTRNDTIRSQYLLHNYYAYDDGSAEFALAINTNGGKVAVKYGLAQPDVMTHVDIYIPSISPKNDDNTSINISVWNNLSGSDPIATRSLTITEPTGINKFTRVQLSSPLSVRDTIYVGYQQLTDKYLGIGFDRSNPFGGDKIYANVSDEWEQNTQFEGALMIRPVFAFDSTYQLSAGDLNNQLIAYPNPSPGVLRVNGTYKHISIYNLLGEQVYDSPYMEEHMLPNLKDGIYLLKITTQSNTITQKFRIRHE